MFSLENTFFLRWEDGDGWSWGPGRGPDKNRKLHCIFNKTPIDFINNKHLINMIIIEILKHRFYPEVKGVNFRRQQILEQTKNFLFEQKTQIVKENEKKML